MPQQRKLLTFLADFLLEEGEASPLRGEELRQSVLETPRATLNQYGLSLDHVELLLEHGPNLGVVLAAIQAEAVAALPGIVDPAPYLWPGDQLFVECIAEPANTPTHQKITVTKGSNVQITIVGGGFSKKTEFFFEKPGQAPGDEEWNEEPKNVAIAACPDARQKVTHEFDLSVAGTYYLRARAKAGDPATGLNDRIIVEAQ